MSKTKGNILQKSGFDRKKNNYFQHCFYYGLSWLIIFKSGINCTFLISYASNLGHKFIFWSTIRSIVFPHNIYLFSISSPYINKNQFASIHVRLSRIWKDIKQYTYTTLIKLVKICGWLIFWTIFLFFPYNMVGDFGFVSK